MAYQRVNPFNGKVLRTFEEYTDQRMEKMLAAADKTFREIWSDNPIRERAKIVGKAASLMRDQKDHALLRNGIAGLVNAEPDMKTTQLSSIRPIDADIGSIARKRRPEWRPQSAVSNRRAAIRATGAEAPVLSTQDRGEILFGRLAIRR